MFAAELKFDKSILRILGNLKRPDQVHKAMLAGSSGMVTRAREILTENQHIITGNLRRSVRVESVSPFVVRIGSPVVYAYFVEVLPDGGFLRPSVREGMEGFAGYVGETIIQEAGR